MIDLNTYNIMKEKYGEVASWAIWRPAGATPKSNTNDMSWVNDVDLLEKINTGFIFVGLNGSSTHGDQWNGQTVYWANFHSGYSRQNDYKLRYATQGTRYWGSYITDLIKHYPEVDSSKVRSYLRNHPEVITENIKEFEKEISYLGKNPIIVALGGATYEMLKKHLGYKYKIALVKHYSFTIGKEDYRDELLSILNKY